MGEVRYCHDRQREGDQVGEQLAENMDHFEVKVGEVNEPVCLAMIECLRLSEVSEVLVVNEDLHQEGGAVEVMLPRLQGVDDSKKFLIVNVIVLLCRGKQLRKIHRSKGANLRWNWFGEGWH